MNCVRACACVVCVFCDCSLGLHLFGFVASATRSGKCAYHGFWIPGSPGAMILDRNCFWKFEGLFCEWVLGCGFVIAVLGLHLFGFVAPATRPGKCAYHEFWNSGFARGHDS